MSGRRLGGLQAAKTIKELYGEDFFRKIGAMSKHKTGGFHHMSQNDSKKHREVSAKGGRVKKERTDV